MSRRSVDVRQNESARLFDRRARVSQRENAPRQIRDSESVGVEDFFRLFGGAAGRTEKKKGDDAHAKYERANDFCEGEKTVFEHE